jgi:predicted ester cyclase
MSITHYKNGKIAESWNVWDALGMMQQLGAMPAAKGRAA